MIDLIKYRQNILTRLKNPKLEGACFQLPNAIRGRLNDITFRIENTENDTILTIRYDASALIIKNNENNNFSKIIDKFSTKGLDNSEINVIANIDDVPVFITFGKNVTTVKTFGEIENQEIDSKFQSLAKILSKESQLEKYSYAIYNQKTTDVDDNIWCLDLVNSKIKMEYFRSLSVDFLDDNPEITNLYFSDTTNPEQIVDPKGYARKKTENILFNRKYN